MAKQASLAASSGVIQAPELKLPAIFSAPTEPVKERHIAPYITFAHPKRADEWGKIKAKHNVDEGDMFLVRPGNIVALPEAKLGLICCKQFWAQANPAGEIQSVSWKEAPHPYKEHIECVVLCYLADEVLPANIQFRTTKCPAGKTLSDALIEAATTAWGERGPGYKESLVCSQPFMRFYGKVSLGPTRTSKSSGLPYRTTVCSVEPTSVSEWRLLKALCENPETQKAVDDAAARFSWRMQELEKKAIK